MSGGGRRSRRDVSDGGDAPTGPGADDGGALSRIDCLLADARHRISPRPAAAELSGLIDAGALVVDIRPSEQRDRDGTLPGAVVIDRNVLEWRLDPTSAHRCPEAAAVGEDATIVLVCNEGYASSLAAASLRDLGLAGATDLDGGYQAWKQLSVSS